MSVWLGGREGKEGGREGESMVVTAARLACPACLGREGGRERGEKGRGEWMLSVIQNEGRGEGREGGREGGKGTYPTTRQAPSGNFHSLVPAW